MKTTINFYEFRNWFEENRPNSFSHDGLVALFDYLEQYESDCDTEIEFDPIAFCCEYTEFNNLKDFQADYGEKYESVQAISDETIVIPIASGSFIIQEF